MKRQWIYVYRTRRPSGWGVHNGYTGLTNAPALRDVQHQAKPWYPLVVKRYLLPLGPCPRFVALALEYVAIKLTMPVYNVQHNRHNPRRIKPWTAKAQRLARDAGHRPYGAMAREVVKVGAVIFPLGMALLWAVR